MKSTRALALVYLLTVAAIAGVLWKLGQPKESNIFLRGLPGISEDVLNSQGRLFHIEEPFLFNRKTGMAVFAVEILSRQNFGNERFLTFAGDARTLQYFANEVRLVNSGTARVGSAAEGMAQGVESLISGLWELLRHPIDTIEGIGSAAVDLAVYVKDTPIPQVKIDIQNLAKVYYVNQACEIDDEKGANYFELKTISGKRCTHNEVNYKLGGRALIELATFLVPFSKLKYGADAAEISEVVDGAVVAGESASAAKRLGDAAVVSSKSSKFFQVGAIFPRMAQERLASLVRSKSATETLDLAEEASLAARATGKSRSFQSFEALKRAFPNKPGMVWHHIVEQRDANIARFGVEKIQTLDNVVEVTPEVNEDLNALYSSKRPDITGSDNLTVRNWLDTRTFEQGTKFGKEAVQHVQSGVWP